MISGVSTPGLFFCAILTSKTAMTTCHSHLGKVAVQAVCGLNFIVTTTCHSKKAGNRPPPSNPRPALRGGVSRQEGAKRPPAFIQHKNRTSALPSAAPALRPETAAHGGPTLRFKGGRRTRMPPAAQESHKGPQKGRHGGEQSEDRSADAERPSALPFQQVTLPVQRGKRGPPPALVPRVHQTASRWPGARRGRQTAQR